MFLCDLPPNHDIYFALIVIYFALIVAAEKYKEAILQFGAKMNSVRTDVSEIKEHSERILIRAYVGGECFWYRSQAETKVGRTLPQQRFEFRAVNCQKKRGIFRITITITYIVHTNVLCSSSLFPAVQG